MGIGYKLKKLIEERKTNVNALANRANVKPTTLYSIIERDNTKVDIEVLIAIAKVLGVSVEYFSDSYEPTGSTYYLDPETAALAQELKNRPEFRVMFDSTKDLDPESIKKIVDFIKYQRHLEGLDD